MQLALNRSYKPKDSFKSLASLVHPHCFDPIQIFRNIFLLGTVKATSLYSPPKVSRGENIFTGMATVPSRSQHRKLSQCSRAKTRPAAFGRGRSGHTEHLRPAAASGFASRRVWNHRDHPDRNSQKLSGAHQKQTSQQCMQWAPPPRQEKRPLTSSGDCFHLSPTQSPRT